MTMRFASRFRLWTTLLPLLAVLLIAGCGRVATHTATYDPPPTPGGRLCSLQCSEANNYCRQTCDLVNRKCVSEIQARALQDYESYTRQQFTNHDAIDLHPRDFERTNSCDDAKATCTANCEGDFQMCYTNCGGVVTKNSSCQFLCF
jgi:hypothetical protein